MASIAQIARSLFNGALFSGLSRFINPDLLMASMYAGVLLASGFLPYEFIDNFSQYVFVEFMMIHLSVAMAVALVVVTNERSKKIAVVVVGLFYSLFVVAFAFALGAWWTALAFLFLIYTRFHEPLHRGGQISLIMEIAIAFARFVIFMLSALAGVLLIKLILGEDGVFAMLAWGTIYYGTLYFFRHKLERLRTYFDK